jgi:hypothetical protein
MYQPSVSSTQIEILNANGHVPGRDDNTNTLRRVQHVLYLDHTIRIIE